MRKFAIYIDGVKTPLNGESGLLFGSPTGLGAQLPTSTVNLRNGFFRAADTDNFPQTSIVGTLTCIGTTVNNVAVSPYEQYHDFTGRLFRGKKIEFAYTPYGSTEYRRLVTPAYITKTELDAHWLSCPISFTALTPWYSVTEVTVPLHTSQSDTNLYTADVTPTGDMPAAFVITANGGTPFTIYAADSNNDTLGVLSLDLSALITQSGSLEYSTAYEDAHATFTRLGTKTDLVNIALLNGDGLDFFPRLPPGETSHILVGYLAGTTKPTSISARIYNYFRSV